MENKEKGVSLIIIFFIMMVIIAVILSVSILLYSEVRIMRNMAASVVSFYAADSGIEKVLYYDRRVIPTGASRGFCSICEASIPTHCPSTSPIADEPSLACNCLSVTPGHLGGCDPNICDWCTISFSTNFDSLATKSYTLTAKYFSKEVYGGNGFFEVVAVGSFYDVGRAVKITNGSNDIAGSSDITPFIPEDPNGNHEIPIPEENPSAPEITSAKAVFTAQGQTGGKITVSADVYDPDGISSVTARIEDQNGSTVNLILTSSGDGNYSKPWNGANQTSIYNVSIVAVDSLGNTAIFEDVPIIYE